MAVYTLPPGALPLTSSTGGPGYYPAAAQQGGLPFAEPSNLTWLMRVTDGIAANIVRNWQVAGGKPEGWDEAKYGSWAAIVQRNAGGQFMNAGDWNTIFRFLKETYVPKPGDWYQTNFGEYIPPTGKEYVLDPVEATKYWTYYNTVANDELERQMKLYQAEAEIIAALYKANTAAPRYSSSGSSYRSGGGGGGDSGAGVVDPNILAKLEMDWKIALLEAEGKMAALKQQERLALLELEADKAFKEASLALEREKLAYQRERDEADRNLQRAALIAKTMADPNDALQREYMLRQFNGLPPGQEPTGTAVDIFTGNVMNEGQPTTFTQLQEQNIQNNNINPFGYTGPPNVMPNPNPPAMARGTQLDENTFGFTREKFFIVGDSEDGKPTGNEELIINHDQGRVTVVPRKYFSAAVSAIRNGRVKTQTKPIASKGSGAAPSLSASRGAARSSGAPGREGQQNATQRMVKFSELVPAKEAKPRVPAEEIAEAGARAGQGIPFTPRQDMELVEQMRRRKV